jgi:hypothetical protein
MPKKDPKMYIVATDKTSARNASKFMLYFEKGMARSVASELNRDNPYYHVYEATLVVGRRV